MKVHPIASARLKRFGHEGCLHPVLGGNRLDHPLVHDRIIARTQRIGLVRQRHFKLARRIFRNRRLKRQPLRVSTGIKIIEEGAEILHLGQAVDLNIMRRCTRMRCARRLWPPVTPAFGINQIKFEFNRDIGRVAKPRHPVDHAAQHMARIKIIGGAVKFIKAS